MNFYAVSRNEKDRDNWTISPTEGLCGWETDSGQDGYGLPKNIAEWIVHILNKHECPFECSVTQWGEWRIRHK